MTINKLMKAMDISADECLFALQTRYPNFNISLGEKDGDIWIMCSNQRSSMTKHNNKSFNHMHIMAARWMAEDNN